MSFSSSAAAANVASSILAASGRRRHRFRRMIASTAAAASSNGRARTRSLSPAMASSAIRDPTSTSTPPPPLPSTSPFSPLTRWRSDEHVSGFAPAAGAALRARRPLSRDRRRDKRDDGESASEDSSSSPACNLGLLLTAALLSKSSSSKEEDGGETNSEASAEKKKAKKDEEEKEEKKRKRSFEGQGEAEDLVCRGIRLEIVESDGSKEDSEVFLSSDGGRGGISVRKVGERPVATQEEREDGEHILVAVDRRRPTKGTTQTRTLEVNRAENATAENAADGSPPAPSKMEPVSHVVINSDEVSGCYCPLEVT